MTNVREIRDRFGIGLGEAGRVLEIAEQRFDGDVRLAAAWVHANAFAINVKGGRDARERWNDDWARNAIKSGMFP